jgi:hypothetical protein
MPSYAARADMSSDWLAMYCRVAASMTAWRVRVAPSRA